MNSSSRTRRVFLRNALTVLSGAFLAGCDALSRSQWFPKLLAAGEHLSRDIATPGGTPQIHGAGVQRIGPVAFLPQ